MGKHAYLILAHKDDFTFRTLLHLLDDERNDIFVHMDKKTKNYVPQNTEHLIHNARLFHTPQRINVQWGGYSMIKAELLLMKTAAESGYHDFYHLLSGEDLPIKTQDEIHCFFDNHPGEEFVQFQSDDFCFWERVQYYHVFQDLIGRDASPLRYRQQQILEKQRKLNIQRNKNIAFQKGTHWFTISDELIKYVLSKKKWISKVFSFTLCADEIFLQTVIINSEYKKRLYYSKFDDNYRAVCRLIDWKRGEPYVYRYTDVDEIRNSPMLFARKFNCEVDREVIEYIAEKIAVNTQ